MAASCPLSAAGDIIVEEALASHHAPLGMFSALLRSELASDDAFVTADVTDASSELGEDLPDEDAE